MTVADRTSVDFHLPRALEILERTPGVFRALLTGLSDDWTRGDEGPDTFSARENLAHLVHADRSNWIVRARIILAGEGDRTFGAFDRFGHRALSAGMGVAELLDAFEAVRRENLATLRGWNLTEVELGLEGVHPALGPITLRQLVATWVAHDLSHLSQTARVLARQYRDTVGPWRTYLTIMDRP